jgi:protein phosphatase 4 regulatory subunit 3
MEILLMLVHNDVCTVRAMLTASPPTLLTQLVSLLLGESPAGLPEQALDCLRSLLDSETIAGLGEQGTDTNNPFLDLFYDLFIERSMTVVVAAGNAAEHSQQAAAGEGVGEGAAAAAAGPSAPAPYIVGLIVELLHFCVLHHMFHVKYYVLRYNILQKVLRLLKSPKKWLATAALRLLRACIGLKDDFYMGYVVRNSLLQTPVEAFLANGDQPDLLNSTFLELVEFIRTQNIKPLIENLIDEHWEDLKGITYVNIFQQLKDKYDAIKV